MHPFSLRQGCKRSGVHGCMSEADEPVSYHLVEKVRRNASQQIDPARKSEFGQFMTPLPVARFMAGMFSRWNLPQVRLLDAGAGVGSLTAAFLDIWLDCAAPGASAVVTAYEIDAVMRRHLSRTLTTYHGAATANGLTCQAHVLADDFIERGSELLLPLSAGPAFTHAILNPPYKKVHSSSRHRGLLREVGIETVNLYTGFLALAAALLEPGGELVAIVPRSFCNGPYYRPFRRWMRERTALANLHLFESRRKTFSDDEVLQENVIVRWIRDTPQGDVLLSWSEDSSFEPLRQRTCPFTEIVHSDDREGFIRIPVHTLSTAQGTTSGDSLLFSTTLGELGLAVSTGPVVDFRLRTHLRHDPEPGAAPLLYPQHFATGALRWPNGGKKPDAIRINVETSPWLFPSGRYVVTKRFTSKEESRRIVAHVVEPSYLMQGPIGFENHLNVFHASRSGLEEEIAYGLMVFLNSTAVDQHFRLFSGHTQVNATDLRSLRYPPAEILRAFGRWALERKNSFDQGEIDRCIEQHVGTRMKSGIPA